MARCGCNGATCSCLVQGSGAVSVSGTGSATSPYVVSASLNLGVSDTSTVDMSISGDGSVANPWVISSTAAMILDALTDVDVSTSTTGQVLAKQANGTWIGVAATTAPTGAINLLSTGGLQGDGSAGNPLSVKLPASSGLILDSTGLRVSGGAAWTTYSAALTATTTNPVIGNGSIDAAYTQQGKSVTVAIEINIGSTTTRGVGMWRVSLPVAPQATRFSALAMSVSAVGVGDYVGTAKIEGLQRIERMHIATSTAAQAISHAVPAAFQSGSRILITGTYEAA